MGVIEGICRTTQTRIMAARASRTWARCATGRPGDILAAIRVAGYHSEMKVTIRIPDDLYRRVKSSAALRWPHIREVTTKPLSCVVGGGGRERDRETGSGGVAARLAVLRGRGGRPCGSGTIGARGARREPGPSGAQLTVLVIDASVWVSAADATDRFSEASRAFLVDVAERAESVVLPWSFHGVDSAGRYRIAEAVTAEGATPAVEGSK